MEKLNRINGGIYLVLNPGMETGLLLARLADALAGGLLAVQIWNNWQSGAARLDIIKAAGRLCQQHNVPLLINQEWELLLQSTWLQGVHFDNIPGDFEHIKKTLNRSFLAGITCSGNLDTVVWANENKLDYISFCSMFPSPSAGHCDLVMPATVRQARGITDLPIFVAGGVTPQNVIKLKEEIPFNGVAVISGILSSANPQQKVKEYQAALMHREKFQQ
ncbi:thiamine phosphate synthase [Mucilaginibacter sp. BT774]|uniref:thiamine phosphate synthase n=1 Tax=Mucilaginibacter sp. BT774 TaxID=3062276 RepID=UPI0026746578|nr:thiamine phosphate synthase [Mucilaginibacter sp. BT774]MDO3627787.1 thiamine phosphate synthase [Mucilaginibacter sp. BT774]